MSENLKTIYRYDTGGRGFKKVAISLFVLATVLMVFGIIWIKSII